ncbi:MAG TPA: recombination regulator RecX [Burkholderiales bacterium]|nr:recombination regulator RecX [Burkholderiales bacterium]
MEERDTPEQLKARALRHLVRREHSRAELARKLAPHAESPAAVEEVLDLLLAKKQQSDARYAEERVRVLSRKYGAAKIRHDLRSKGIADGIVDALSSEGEMERARAILERRYSAPAATREERAKRARFLQGRGFSSDVIVRLVLDREEAS